MKKGRVEYWPRRTYETREQRIQRWIREHWVQAALGTLVAILIAFIVTWSSYW